MPRKNQKNLYEIDGEIHVLSEAETSSVHAQPCVLMRIVRPTVGAETPLHLKAPRVNRVLRPGDLIVVVGHRAPVYRDQCEAMSTASVFTDALRLPDLDPAITAYLEYRLTAFEASKPQDTDDASPSADEAQSTPRRKRSKSRS